MNVLTKSFVFLIVVLFLSPVFSAGAWWDSGWDYRKQVTVTDTSGSDLADFQVLVEFNSASLVSAGTMKSDCGDLRFADSSGTQELSYWVESGCGTTNTKVWVKVPSVPANSSVDIHMYYGNAEVESASDGEATFEFFDDFEGTSLDASKWVNSKGVSLDTVNHYAKVDGISTSNNQIAVALMSRNKHAYPFVMESRTKIKTGGSYSSYNYHHIGTRSCQTPTYRGDCIRDAYYPRDTSCSWNTNFRVYGGTSVAGVLPKPTEGVWFRSTVQLASGDSKVIFGGSVAPTADPIIDVDNYISFTTRFWAGAHNEQIGIDWTFLRKYASTEPSVSVSVEGMINAPIVTDISFDLPSFEVGQSVTATATATDPDGNPVTSYDFRVLDGLGNEALNPAAQGSGVYSFVAEGEPGLWQVRAKASDGEYWGGEFSREVFVNDSSLATAGLGLSDGAHDNTELSEGKVILSGTQSSGTFTTNAIEPVNFSKWGVVTFSKTTPGDSRLTVDILDASDDSVLVSNVQNGQNISGLEVTAIKLRANFTSGSTPSLDLWDVSYYTQFKITVTNCSAIYSGDVTAEAVRVSDSEEFGLFTGTGGQVFVEVPPGVYNLKACIPANEKCNWKYNVELA
ncbi:MAG: DUF2341 domain-containing protein [Candidatus Diapherotrites archaeon]|nr:DUF2341 domain-containing protein [Candidatus Diapherotrites archaeon]